MITQINFIFWCFYKSNYSNDDDDDNEFDYDDDNEFDYDNDNDEINVVYDIIHNYRCINNYIHYCIQKEED